MSLRALALLFPASALLAAAATANPQLGEQKFFKNWAVACDNTLSCEAVALQPESVPGDNLSLVVWRDAQSGEVNITLIGQPSKSDRMRIFIDGRLAYAGSVPADETDSVRVSGPDAIRLARAMAKGSRLVLRDGSGVELGEASLSGSTAALLHIDSIQNRAGTREALTSPGRKALRPKWMPKPVIVAKRFKEIETVPDAATLVSLVEGSACAEERYGVTEDTAYSLGAAGGKARALVMLSCGSGAYNFASAAYIGTEDSPKKWSFAPARFDYGDKIRTMDESLQLLVNADWDSASQTLSSHAKGRGLGDCGNSETYVWDGEMFHLTSAYGMIECRGSMDWMTLWRSEVKLVG